MEPNLIHIFVIQYRFSMHTIDSINWLLRNCSGVEFKRQWIHILPAHESQNRPICTAVDCWMWCSCPFCHIACSHPSKWLVHHCKNTKRVKINLTCKKCKVAKKVCPKIDTHPPPIVIIEASAAINSSEPCPRFLSLSMPTQGYFARSGYSENRNVSPVPKYACRCPLSSFRLRSNQRVEQYAPNTYSKRESMHQWSF